MADRAVGGVLVVLVDVVLAARHALALAVELLHQQHDGGLVRERDVPLAQAPVVVVQLQVAHAAMILQAQALVHSERPLTPLSIHRIASQQTLLRQRQQAISEAQIRAQVNRDDS